MSALKEELQHDLTAAMHAKDKIRVDTLRMVLTAITNEEVAGKTARSLTDAEVITVLTREAKKRKEAATAYDDAKRPELADRERAELAIIATFLPEELSAAELAQIIADAVAQAAAEGKIGPSAMGVVMKIVQPKTAGRADGAAVAAAVKAALG